MTPTSFGAEHLSEPATRFSAAGGPIPWLCIPEKPRYYLYDIDGDGIPEAIRYI